MKETFAKQSKLYILKRHINEMSDQFSEETFVCWFLIERTGKTFANMYGFRTIDLIVIKT